MSGNREIAFFAVLFLFFFQLLTEFVAAVYAFGLLGVNIPVETVCIVLFFSPFLLTFLRKPLSGKFMAVAGALTLLAGLLSMFPDTRYRMLLSGFGTACFLVFFPAHLCDASRPEGRSNPVGITAGLVLGVALFILFRALNSGIYPYAETWFRVVSAAFAVTGALLLPPVRNVEKTETKEPGGETTGSAGGLAWAGIGLFAVFTLLYFAFGSPYVTARWTGAGRFTTLALAAGAISLFSCLLVFRPVLNVLTKGPVLIVLNLLFVPAIAGAILPQRAAFSADPSAYPLYQPEPGLFGVFAIVPMFLLFPVVFLDFLLFLERFRAAKPSIGKTGAAFGLGSAFLLFAAFAQILTTVYDYMPVIGPIFRDKFFHVLVGAGLFLAVPAVILRKTAVPERERISLAFPAAVLLCSLVALAGASVFAYRPVSSVSGRDGLRVLTWNIQQGYSSDGQRSHDEQIEIIRYSGADVVGLQETDSARVSGGNADLAGYYAERLGMHAYHGPKVVSGTFGITLLSRYEIGEPETLFMYSAGEQTAAIRARIRTQGKLYNVFVTHLGNEGDMVQQRAVLEAASGLENVIMMGDFNFTPDTAQYAVTASAYDDAWLKRPSGAGAAEEPHKRIDHVFVSRNLEVLSAEYLESPASDHPSLTVEVR